MDRKLQGALHILFVIVIVAAAVVFSENVEEYVEYGYAGVFFIALLSTATIIFPSPGWAAVIAMSAFLDPLLLGIAAGIGASIGELTGYLAGEGVRDFLNNSKHSKKSPGEFYQFPAA